MCSGRWSECSTSGIRYSIEKERRRVRGGGVAEAMSKLFDRRRIFFTLPSRASVQRTTRSLRCFFFVLFLLYSNSQAGAVSLEQLNPEFIPFFADDLDRASLKTAIQQSLFALRKRNAAELVVFGDHRLSLGRLRDSLEAFLALIETEPDLGTALLRNFDIYRVTLPILITGYHEPVLTGSLVRTERYRYPLYRRPDDLPGPGALSPYFSRAEIDGRGILDGKGYELLWLDDPVARFFLHIQGSGQIQLPGERRIRVGYAADNGRPYQSIGRFLLDQGKLHSGEVSTPAIRRYLETHSNERDETLFHNPRYIFFKAVPDGPIGSLGVPLTPGRSLATDPTVYPLGALAFIHTKRPTFNPKNQLTWQEFFRFVLLQDSGAAIVGPSRADLFWGSAAEAEAGYMAQQGELYLLVKKQ